MVVVVVVLWSLVVVVSCITAGAPNVLMCFLRCQRWCGRRSWLPNSPSLLWGWLTVQFSCSHCALWICTVGLPLLWLRPGTCSEHNDMSNTNLYNIYNDQSKLAIFLNYFSFQFFISYFPFFGFFVSCFSFFLAKNPIKNAGNCLIYPKWNVNFA